jgi:hypothetical protein
MEAPFILPLSILLAQEIVALFAQNSRHPGFDAKNGCPEFSNLEICKQIHFSPG